MVAKKISELDEDGAPGLNDWLEIEPYAGGTSRKTQRVNLTGPTGPTGPMGPAGIGDMQSAENLLDLADAATARTNLGLGSAATTASTDYATAAQGATADTALQDPSAFATAAQGATADTALQDPSVFATTAQGALADAAAPLSAASTTRFRGYGVTEPSTDLQIGDVFFKEA